MSKPLRIEIDSLADGILVRARRWTTIGWITLGHGIAQGPDNDATVRAAMADLFREMRSRRAA